MFLTVKKKWILIVICAVLVVAGVLVYFTALRPASTPKPVHSIVIDAGHGGIDGGCEGVSGSDEASLNLKYALALQNICKSYGFKVVLTRKDGSGLYSIGASNRKKSEMQKRKSLIENSGCEMVVSLHMNAFPLPSARGAQVFYAQGNTVGQNLADSVSTSLSQTIKYAKKTSKVGDYFVLNCTSKPAILIECGFLSNAEEEKLLLDDDYMNDFCVAIFAGILNFLS